MTGPRHMECDGYFVQTDYARPVPGCRMLPKLTMRRKGNAGCAVSASAVPSCLETAFGLTRGFCFGCGKSLKGTRVSEHLGIQPALQGGVKLPDSFG